MTQLPTLLSVMNDPWWSKSVRVIYPDAPRLPIVKVEGISDWKFFNKSMPRDSFGKKRCEFSFVCGKDNVIKQVEADKSSFGIVDMDFDFESDLVSNPRIIDTSDDCCLFSKIYRTCNYDLALLFGRLINGLVKTGEASKLHEMVSERHKELVDRIKEDTAERLYRGYKRHHKSYKSSLEEFNDEFTKQIDAAGINDHSFVNMFQELLAEVGLEIEEDVIEKAIFNIFLGQRNDSRRMEGIAMQFAKDLRWDGPKN